MDWLKVKATSKGVGVDREAKVIRGYVLAQQGPFKSKGRGQFDLKSLEAIVDLAGKEPKGLKSRLSHPTLSDDGIGTFLGRAKNARMDEATIRRDGKEEKVHAVRADLHLDPASFHSPKGNLGGYVLDLAESDPDAFSSSLVLQSDKEQLLGTDGKPLKDQKGDVVPPVWRPVALHASDVVDTGDAVDGFLSVVGGAESLSIEGLSDVGVRQAAAILAEQFPNATRDELKAKLSAWLDRYLAWRFGDEERSPEEPPPASLRAEREREIAELAEKCGLDTVARGA